MLRKELLKHKKIINKKTASEISEAVNFKF